VGKHKENEVLQFGANILVLGGLILYAIIDRPSGRAPTRMLSTFPKNSL
jgi:hypothetical protein